jgi:hypothetical protein
VIVALVSPCGFPQSDGSPACNVSRPTTLCPRRFVVLNVVVLGAPISGWIAWSWRLGTTEPVRWVGPPLLLVVENLTIVCVPLFQ